MAGALDVIVRFIGDSSNLTSEVGKIEKSGDRLKTWAKGIGTAVATGFAVKQVADFGQASVNAALESEKATAGLENVFKSMGDETGNAAKAAEAYASAMSKKIGVDDEAIISGQTLLATFSHVSDQTARQAGIFDRATAAAADLAAAGFGNIDTNAKQLGKALQDPVKGITALAKAGVTFTDQQKEQIKTFVASGDILSAQKIVLGEVEHQVKGTAAATATGSDKMKVAWGETQESIGKALIPILEKLLPILEKVATFIQNNTTWILPLAAVLGVLAVAWNIASLAATLFGTTMLVALGPVLLVIAAIAALVAIGILIVKNWDTIKAAAEAVWGFVLDAVKGVFNWISDNWPLLLAILTGPFGLAILAIVKHWDTITEKAKDVFNWIRTNWPLLLAILTGPFGLAVLAIVKNWQSILDFFKGIPGKIGDLMRGLADTLIAPFRSAFNSIATLWNATIGKLSFTVPSWIPGIGGKGFDVPDIPRIDTGGFITQTGLAVVHRGENVIPAGMGAGATFNINVAVAPGTDPAQTGRAIVDVIQAFERANGSDWRARPA